MLLSPIDMWSAFIHVDRCSDTLSATKLIAIRYSGALLVEELVVDEGGRNASQEGRGPEDPVVVPDAGHERRPESARWVDAHAADGPLQPHQQRHYEPH